MRKCWLGLGSIALRSKLKFFYFFPFVSSCLCQSQVSFVFDLLSLRFVRDFHLPLYEPVKALSFLKIILKEICQCLRTSSLSSYHSGFSHSSCKVYRNESKLLSHPFKYHTVVVSAL